MASFGDLLGQHLNRKRGLSQNKLALDIDVDPSVISKMCNGKRLNGRYSRERVLKIIAWLHDKGVLEHVGEADALLEAAGMTPLSGTNDGDVLILGKLDQQGVSAPSESRSFNQERVTTLLLFAVLFMHILEKVALILKQENTVIVVCSKCHEE